MSESANSAKSAKQIFANFVKFVKPIFGTTRRSVGRVTEAEYPTNYQRISNLSLTIRPFRVAILAVLLLFVGSWNVSVWANKTHTGKTAVVAGKGTATVKIHYRKSAFTGDDAHTGDEKSTTGSVLVTASYPRKDTQDGSIAFYATPSKGYSFVGWYENADCSGNPVSTSTTYWAERRTFSDGITKIAYAKFSPTDVTFNANGGSVEPSFKTVTDNGTYGTLPVPTRANYTFLNWYTGASDGSVVTSSTKVTKKVNHTLYAHWTPNYTIKLTAGSGTTSAGTTSITVALNLNNDLTDAITTPTKSGNVFDGYYTGINGTGTQIIDAFGNIIAQAGGDNTYTDASKNWKYANNIELFANWIAKYDFEITGSNYTINNEAWTQTKAFNFVHADENHMTTTIQNPDVISYDRASNTITAKKIGTSKITFTQNTSTTVNNGSIVFTITVDSVANNLTVSGTSFEKYVEQEVTSVRSKQNSDGTITATSSNPNLAHYDIANNKIVIPNSAAQKLPFDDVTITISQAATAKYKAKKHTITLKVEKYANTIKVKNSTNYSSSINVDSKDNGLSVTATNTDYAGSPISVGQTAGKDIATYSYNQSTRNGDVSSNYKLGTATWTLSQPENYKYQAGNGSFTVTVAKAAEAADCYVKTDINSGHKFSDSWKTTWNDENAAGTLRFEACAQAAWTYGMNVYQLIDGNWSLIEYIDYDHMHTSYTDYSYSLDQRAKGVKFEQKGTLNRWVKNVYVTRSTYINASNVTIDRTSTNNPVYPSDGTGVGTLTINYSLANGGDLKITNDNPDKFTLSKKTISNVDCKTGSENITVSYTSDAAGTDTAHLVIYNKVYRKEVTVTGITSKRDQEVHWEIGDALRVGTQTENAAWVTVGSEVSYSSNKPNLLEVVDGKLVAKAEGEVTITATAPGNGEYNDVEDQKTITITNDLIQSIVWEQNFLRLKLGGANQTLNAYAVSDEEDCTTDRARLITYKSSDESVVKVINNSNQLQIVGAGQAVLTARQAGGVDADGHKYMAVSAEKTVIVRDPNAPCDNYLYIQPQENKWDCGWNHANRQYREFIIDDLDEPSTLYLQYKGEYKTVAFDYFYGTMHVDEWYDGDWHEVPNGNLGTPTIGTYKTLNTTLQRKTTKVRISTHEGVGYHYFKDCKIGQSRYIEASDLTTFEAKVGQPVNQDLTIRYNNITGPVTLSLGSNNSKFSLSQQSIYGDCGDKGTVDVTVSYLPTVEADEEELLTISDGTTTLKVTLHGVATKTSRHIDWNIPETNNVHTVDVVELGAQALTDVGNTTAGNVFYAISSSSPAGVGSVAGSNLTFAKAGTVVVTANTVNDARYNDAVAVSKTYNVAITPTTISTMPVLAEVTSGTAAGEIELTGWQVTNTVNGGVVEGTLAITSADLTNVGTNTVTLTFTPSNTDMYSGCTGTTTIVVNKAVSVATPSAANIVYGQKVNESVLSNEGTEGTWAWTDAKAEDVLDAGTYEGLAVHFTPSSGNYTELDATVSLTVEKATPEVTAQASAITYGQAISASELSTATGDISGTWAWAVDEEQVLSVGNHVLKANFTSTNANYSDLSNVDVKLTVNKIEKLEVPVALSFCAGGSVNFHGNTYTETGEYQIEAEGATRDTVYNVTVTRLQPTTGTDSKTITVGANESWNGINLSGYAVGSHEVEFHTANAAGCDSTVTLALTVVPATNIFTNEAGDGEWSEPTNWSNGVPTGDEPDVIISGDLIIDEELTVGNLTIEKNSRVVLTVNGDLTVNGVSEDRTEYGNLYVQNGGEVEINGGLRVGDLTVEASIGTSDGTAESGQVDKAENIVYANAYIEINMDPKGTMDDTKWYGFTVPFEVNAHNGISRKVENSYQNCNYGTDYIIAEYDAAKRLSSGKGWKYLSGNTLNAGQFYYFGGDGGYNTYRFKASGNIYTPVAEKILSMNGTGADANWNAVGNSTLQHAKVSFEGGNYVQVYQNGLDAYKTVATSEATFVVGCPFFIQASENATLALSVPTDASEKYYAPRRSNATQDGVARVNLTSVDGGYSDQIYVSGTEKENDEYVLGHDLSKAGLGTAIPQLWVDAYGQKLSVHEAVWQGENALCQLGIYAPKEGEYTLTATQPEDGTQVYLTIDGMPVWNLSETAYILSLGKGTMNNYGLMLLQASRMPTGVENVESADDEKAKKIILNDHLYILRDSRMYDATGKKVK